MYLLTQKYKDFIRFNVVKRENFTLFVVNSVEFRFGVNQQANNGQVAMACGMMKWRLATIHSRINSLIDRCHKLNQVNARQPIVVLRGFIRACVKQQTNNGRVAFFAGNMKWREPVTNI